MKIHSPSLRISAALFAAVALCSTSTRAANVTWGAPQQISGASDVSTAGTLVGAFNVGDQGVPSTTVNGVTFQSFATNGGTGSSGNFTATGSGFIATTNTGHGSSNPPFSALPAAYQTLLQSASVPFAGTVQLVISGLIAGMQYQFQWWSNDSSQGGGGQTTATAGNSVVLNGNTTFGVSGGLGEYVIGTFTADAATQTISFAGDGDYGSLNAFQLRNVTPRGPSVPDSGSTIALLGCAAGGMALAGRKLQRA